LRLNYRKKGLNSLVLRRKIDRCILYTILVIFALWTLLPLYWMVTASFKTRVQIFEDPTLFFKFTLQNYREACIPVWLKAL